MIYFKVPGKPVAHDLGGLLSMNYGLLCGIVASDFGLLGFPDRYDLLGALGLYTSEVNRDSLFEVWCVANPFKPQRIGKAEQGLGCAGSSQLWPQE